MTHIIRICQCPETPPVPVKVNDVLFRNKMITMTLTLINDEELPTAKEDIISDVYILLEKEVIEVSQ